MKITNKQLLLLGIIAPIIIAIFTWYIMLQQTTPLSEINTASNSGTNTGTIAGKIVVINNTGRHLNSELKTELNTGLNKYILEQRVSKNIKIRVKYENDDSEGRQFASEIKAYLESQNWNVDSYLSGVYPTKSLLEKSKNNDLVFFITTMTNPREDEEKEILEIYIGEKRTSTTDI